MEKTENGNEYHLLTTLKKCSTTYNWNRTLVLCLAWPRPSVATKVTSALGYNLGYGPIQTQIGGSIP